MTHRQSRIFNRHAAKKRYRVKLVERTSDMFETSPGLYEGVNLDTVVSVIGFANLKEMGDFLRGNPAPKGLIYDFRGQDLSGADFTGAKLHDADFTNCPLKRVSFRNADLTEAVFSGADLRKADFAGADMTHATMHEARLSGAKFKRTTVTNVNFHHIMDKLGPFQRRGMVNKRQNRGFLRLR